MKQQKFDFPIPLSSKQNAFLIDKGGAGTRVVSNMKFPRNTNIAYISSGSISKPSYQTIQIGLKTHLLEPILLAMNHSCDPNIFIDTKNMLIKSIRDINTGDELRFFYPSTEWSMARPFQCNCGAINCLGLINGASSIIKSDVIKLYLYNDHILESHLHYGNAG